MAASPIPDSDNSPQEKVAPPIPMVSVREKMMMFRVFVRSTLCCNMLVTPAVAMVPKISSMMPPSTALGMDFKRALIFPTKENRMAVTAAIRMTCGWVTWVIDMAPVTSA